MEENRRKQILDNIDKLIDFTDFKKLCDACYEYKLLSLTMITNIHRITPPNHIYSKAGYNKDDMIERERHMQLFIKITKRGPEAFDKLRRIFVALKYEDALNVLFNTNEDLSLKSSNKIGKRTNINFASDEEHIDKDEVVGQVSNNNITLHEYEGLIQPKKNIIVRKANNISIHPKLGSYQMESKDKRGVFFLVRSDNHQEFDDDDHSLLSLFQQLDFKLYAYNNMTFKMFTKLLEELLRSDKIKNIECFVLAIRTRGKLIKDFQRMVFNDGSIARVEQILEYFNQRNCPDLLGRPKIFIFPYKEIPRRRIQTDGIGQGGHFLHVPQLSDVINCYVATTGYMDQRDNNYFSCYIQNFVDVISERACNTHFDDMLKIIHERVAEQSKLNGHQQETSYENISFNKTLYFNPGISN